MKKFRVESEVNSALLLFLTYLFRTSNQDLLIVAKNNDEAYKIQKICKFYLDVLKKFDINLSNVLPEEISQASNNNSKIGSENIIVMPWLDVPIYSEVSVSDDILANRVRSLHELNNIKEPIIFISPLESFLFKTASSETLNSSIIRLEKEKEYNIEELLNKLISIGYARQELIYEAGEFSKRGSILDIFSCLYKHPARIDFFGDTIENIKQFNIDTQLSSKELDEYIITFEREFAYLQDNKAEMLKKTKDLFESLDFSRKEQKKFAAKLENRMYFPGIDFYGPLFYDNLSNILEYFQNRKQNPILAYSEDIYSKIEIFENSLSKKYTEVKDQNRAIFPPEMIFTRIEEFKKTLNSFGEISFSEFYSSDSVSDELRNEFKIQNSKFKIENSTETRCQSQTSEFKIQNSKFKIENSVKTIDLKEVLELALVYPNDDIQKLLEKVLQHSNFKLYFVAGNLFQAEKMSKYLESAHNLKTVILKEKDHIDLVNESPSVFPILISDIGKGFISYKNKFALITTEDLFGEKARTYRKALKSKKSAFDISDLSVGDYVVHLDHGVGRFDGLVNLKHGNLESEYLSITYSGNDLLYLPVDKIFYLQKFIKSKDSETALDRLGGKAWEAKKSKAQKMIEKVAKELVALYAQRKIIKGHAFAKRDSLLDQFEATFTFDETQDQLRTIEDVYEDMEKDVPMDRLVCGDVGFGKTEVAIRASFKASMEGYQVAIIAPTTVLVLQHYETFTKRLKNYPLKVEFLSRLQKIPKQKEIIKELSEGLIDIVIGTHKLLGEKIKFKNLGLIIVDEEHRFGVQHKEKLKLMKSKVDVLTLTATPIPRTLQFSMMGLRDLSVINTPPASRKAVKTFVSKFDELLIKEAIYNEVRRSGQVYFIHNTVRTIQAMTNYLQKLCPDVSFAYAHGQMSPNQLEKIMVDFVCQKIDCLVCSTIVESGLDITNANTMIINKADRFGLAQLYQLRGRVGRSDRIAYAYLLIPDIELITDDAKKRLKVIQRYTDLGSGFKVSMHDLEIRGGGNILGEVQSGHINAIGLELFVKMLENTIRQMKGETIDEEIDVDIKLNIPAFIPSDYMSDQNMRILYYRRFANCQDNEDVENIISELIDRMGKVPVPVSNMADLVKLKMLAKKYAIFKIDSTKEAIFIKYHETSAINAEFLLELLAGKNRVAQKLEGDVLKISHEIYPEMALVDKVMKLIKMLFINSLVK
ncbi:MAG: transcription-repair coupling factor [Pseudomonadota bacterium]